MANNLVDQTGVGADKNKVNAQPVNKGMVPAEPQSAEQKRQARLAGHTGTPASVDADGNAKSKAGKPNQVNDNGHVSEHIGAGGVPTGELDPNLDRSLEVQKAKK